MRILKTAEEEKFIQNTVKERQDLQKLQDAAIQGVDVSVYNKKAADYNGKLFIATGKTGFGLCLVENGKLII